MEVSWREVVTITDEWAKSISIIKEIGNYDFSIPLVYK